MFRVYAFLAMTASFAGASPLLGGDFSIADFGARSDGTKCTVAFSQAFAAAENVGGGRIVVPCGKWFTGPVKFRSNCELHLENGAEVVFSQDPDDYLPAVFTSWEGMECWNYSPLVYAYGCTNVSITGTGTLRAFDGEWKDSFWRSWTRNAEMEEAARLQLYTWGATDYPVDKREIWKLKSTRPHFIQFNRCRNVRLEDVKVRNSPFWTIHLYQSEEVSVRGLDVCARGKSANNDGIDIEMSRNVLVEKCIFDQGDDGIVIKAGRNRDAWRIGKPTENVLVRDCEIRYAGSVLAVGSEISGGIRNVTLANCTAGSVARVFYLKTNRRRGGFLENILCENIRVGETRQTVFEIATDVLYEWRNFPDYENRTTRIANIMAENIHSEKTKNVVRICGDQALPPTGVRWRNVTASSVSGEPLFLKDAGDAHEIHAVDKEDAPEKTVDRE